MSQTYTLQDLESSNNYQDRQIYFLEYYLVVLFRMMGQAMSFCVQVLAWLAAYYFSAILLSILKFWTQGHIIIYLKKQ